MRNKDHSTGPAVTQRRLFALDLEYVGLHCRCVGVCFRFGSFCCFYFVDLFSSMEMLPFADAAGGMDLRGLRTFRVLRPLKLVSGIPSAFCVPNAVYKHLS